jgi:hypothetical protein
MRDKLDEPWNRNTPADRIVDLWEHYGTILIMLILFTIFGILTLKYMPVLEQWVVQEYEIQGAGKRNMFIGSLILNCGTFVMLFFIFLFSGRVTMTWLKSWITGRPIIQLFTKSNSLKFIVPKKEELEMYEITKDGAALPNDDAFVFGPHRVQMSFAMPELPTLFNPRKIIGGAPLGIDMVSIKEYAIKHEMRALNSIKGNWEFFKPFIGPIILFAVIALIFWPIASKRLTQDSQIMGLQDALLSCRSASIAQGCSPPGIMGVDDEGVPVDKTVVKPASSGGQVSPLKVSQ